MENSKEINQKYNKRVALLLAFKILVGTQKIW